jgi:DNA-binding NtrC family response regulator
MYDRSLLLVDDEMSILRSCARELRLQSYDVTTAASGDEAIEAIWQNNFKAVITDLIMPGADGLMVLREAKKRNPASCVIILTGYGDMTSAVAALRLGADDYLLKPVDIDDLRLRLAKYLVRQQERLKIMLPDKILTLCTYCRCIRDAGTGPGGATWVNWELYLTDKTGVNLSHGCCPACFKKLGGKRNES